MSSLHIEKWIAAAVSEICSLEEHDTWKEVLLFLATKQVIPGTWDFKLKPILMAHSRSSKPATASEVTWKNHTLKLIHLLLVIAQSGYFWSLPLRLVGIPSQLTFPMHLSKLWFKKTPKIHLPCGFISSLPGKTCLKLTKSVNGKIDSSHLWYLHLSKPLLELRFVPSEHDRCFHCILILFVDDVGIAYKSKKVMENLLEALKSHALQFTHESSFNEYLGI